MPLHSLQEVPEEPREYLVIEHGQKDLICRTGSYEEIEDWLAGELVHNNWLRVMDHIAACEEIGQFTLFDLGRTELKTTVVVKLNFPHTYSPKKE